MSCEISAVAMVRFCATDRRGAVTAATSAATKGLFSPGVTSVTCTVGRVRHTLIWKHMVQGPYEFRIEISRIAISPRPQPEMLMASCSN
jgi:hypothetical protein